MEMNMAKMTQGQMKARASTLQQAAYQHPKDSEERKSLLGQWRECRAMCQAGAHLRN